LKEEALDHPVEIPIWKTLWTCRETKSIWSCHWHTLPTTCDSSRRLRRKTPYFKTIEHVHVCIWSTRWMWLRQAVARKRDAVSTVTQKWNLNHARRTNVYLTV
jgi:hypothetical protein